MPVAKIIILNWNGADHLRRFLPSVVAAAPAGVEVIVADNGSTDDSLAALAAGFPSVTVLRMDRNYGFAGGYNRALEYIEADYYLLLNSDVETPEGWLAPILDCLDRNPDVAVAAPKLISCADRTEFEYAGAAGYVVDSALTKSAASNFLTKQDYDLIVLDVNLPDGNGFDFCREVKERRPDTAVIFLTANDMESDMLKGYELGAEDYVTKPFPMSVFQKKLSVVLGRLAKQSGGDCYEDGALSINFSEMTASLSGKPLVFTPLEYRLLKILTKNPQNVLTRQVLLEKLWDADGNFVDEHALTSAISRVRNKIETDGRQYIKTVYGMGYMWIGGASK